MGALSRQRLLQASDDGDASALLMTMATAMTLLHLDAFPPRMDGKSSKSIEPVPTPSRRQSLHPVERPVTCEKTSPTKPVHQEGVALERAAFPGLDERRVYTLSLLSSAMLATHS